MTRSTFQQTFEAAHQHYQAGRLREAEALYRQVLAQNPNHVDALHMLGALAHQTGHPQDALKLIDRAIKLQPFAPHYLLNRGVVLEALGRPDEAIAAYQAAAKLRPDFA